jgi:hypothetical protein
MVIIQGKLHDEKLWEQTSPHTKTSIPLFLLPSIYHSLLTLLLSSPLLLLLSYAA